MAHKGHYWCKGTSRGYWFLSTGSQPTVSTAKRFVHTRVSISSWDVHAITRFAFIRSTLLFSKQGERDLVLESNIYLCWKTSRKTTLFCWHPGQRLPRHSWNGLRPGPNPFPFLLCNRTPIIFWGQLCSAKWPHFTALLVAGVATEI